MNKHKVISIQILRAFACLIVLQLHLFGRLFYLNGSLGVDLFFIISGYIIASSVSRLPDDKRPVLFFINRFSRVAPYYYLLTILYYIVVILFKAESFNLNRLVGSILFIPHKGDPVLGLGWSLVHEVFFYSFIALCLIFTRDPKKLALAYVLFLSLIHLTPEFTYTITFLKASINYNFIYGMIIFVYRERITAVFEKFLPILLSLTVFTLVYFFTGEKPWNESQRGLIAAAHYYYRDINFIKNVNFAFFRAFLFGIPSALLFASMLSLENKLKKYSNNFLVRLGDVSYSIYLLQIFPFFLVSYYHLSNAYIISAFFAVTMLISFYMYKVEDFLNRVTKSFLLKTVRVPSYVRKQL